MIPEGHGCYPVGRIANVAEALRQGGRLSRDERYMTLSREVYQRLRRMEDGAGERGRGGCSDCGGKINAAQVKASPAAMEAFLREE